MTKRNKIITLVCLALIFVVSIIIISINTKKTEYVYTAPEYIGNPITNFTGEKSKELYDSISDTNYTAARNIVGDFLINNEKVDIKQGTKTTAIAEIKSYSIEYGEKSKYIVNFEFLSLDNGKKYQAKIINYLDGSQSSKLIVVDKNYEKTFGNVID
jgi:hypothetical protein